MKIVNLFVLLMGLFFFTSAWALKTKIDPTIYMNELRSAGIRHAERVMADLSIENPGPLVIKHVITTGRTKADKNYIVIGIADLEKISPKVSSSAVMSARAVSLSNDQIESIMHIAKTNEDSEKWLMDKSKKKYIQIVLQKENSDDNKISPVTKAEAKSLIKWAIKNKHLDEKDHETEAAKMTE